MPPAYLPPGELMRFRTLLPLALAALATLPAAHADEASHRAKAEQMLSVTKSDSQMQTQLSALEARINELAKQQSGVTPLNPEQTKLTEAYQKQIHDITMDEVGWEKLHPLVLQYYVDSFTEAELDGILAFYKTPAGQALITKAPELAAKSTGMVQTRIRELQPKLASATQDYVAKLKAAASPSSGAAPAAGAPAGAPPSLKTPATKLRQ